MCLALGYEGTGAGGVCQLVARRAIAVDALCMPLPQKLPDVMCPARTQVDYTGLRQHDPDVQLRLYLIDGRMEVDVIVHVDVKLTVQVHARVAILL